MFFSSFILVCNSCKMNKAVVISVLVLGNMTGIIPKRITSLPRVNTFAISNHVRSIQTDNDNNVSILLHTDLCAIHLL